MKKEENNMMEKIVSLARRRGFVFPGSEVYGGLANSWDYGPLGVELKNNIKQLWWSKFVHRRDDMVGIDAALLMNPKVWESSGHLKNFSDFLAECKKCHHRVRVDHFLGQAAMQKFGKEFMEAGNDEGKVKKVQTEMTAAMNTDAACPNCGKKDWTEARPFNLMLSTLLGPTGDESARVYFRPETAQAMFVDFKSVLETSRKKLPFGIAQAGKAFRNEITPGNFIFRTREFEQMEIEYFIHEPARDEDWNQYFEMWRMEMRGWMEKDLGLDMSHVHELEVPDGDRAHYSKRTVDFEYDYPFGRRELYGLAYRTNFDLKNHFKEPPYKDAEGGEAFWPHVIEPTWGVDRSVLAVLCDAYKEEGERVVLALKPKLAPYKAAIFPLLANKPPLVEAARKIYDELREHFPVAWDDRGNIGKRYYSQDEIGTPFCITVDFDSLEKGDVTVRNRDTAKQERIAISELAGYLRNKIEE